LKGGGNTSDLLEMLRSLQLSVLSKIAKSSLDEYDDVKLLLETVINLGFSGNPSVSHSLCTILTRVINIKSLSLFENDKNRNLRDLMVLLIQYWLSEQAEFDSYILKATVKLID
jgi:hypothetical protein